ncbi:hypothetical protein HID58_014583 [Brassica napus]|uniref:Uncharacterized protein n=1 Tax=Brassica napus TaxID=3708 RepID=A0ABQ8DHQ8_BRANA|nr:hypothetical protein HID58_014583 [Brassica napus]
MVEIWKSKCRRAFSRSVAKVFNLHRNFNMLLLHCSSIQKQLESLLSIVGGVYGEPKTSSTTVSGKSQGDSVVVSDEERREGFVVTANGG